MPRHVAIFLVLLSAAAFGSMAIFAKAAYAAGLTPTMLLALRFALAAAMLAPLVRLRRAPLPRGRALAGFVLMGLLYNAQAQSYFTALMHASSGLVGLLLYVYPVLVALLSAALGWETLDRRTGAILALAIAGMAVTLGGDLQGTPFGIALGLLSAAIYAVYIVTGSRVTQGRTDPLAGTLVIMTVAAAGTGGLARGGGSTLPASADGWLAAGAIAALTAVAIATFLIGIKYIGPAQASIISTLEPVVTLCLGIALLGEAVSVAQLGGGVMVLAAVVMLALRPRTQDRSHAGVTAG